MNCLAGAPVVVTRASSQGSSYSSPTGKETNSVNQRRVHVVRVGDSTFDGTDTDAAS